MNPPVRFISVLILLAAVSAGCQEEGDKSISKSYLDSESYRQFDQQSEEEGSFRTDENTAFKRVLSKLLGDRQTDELNLPLEIDSLSVEQYLKSAEGFELEQSMLNEPAEMNYTYYPVGKAGLEDIQLLFFLTRQQSVYDDLDLSVATFSDTSLVDVQSVGKFKKSISLRVQSEVQIDPSLTITSEITRRPRYPIPQEFITTYRYTINRKGEINEEVISGDD